MRLRSALEGGVVQGRFDKRLHLFGTERRRAKRTFSTRLKGSVRKRINALRELARHLLRRDMPTGSLSLRGKASSVHSTGLPTALDQQLREIRSIALTSVDIAQRALDRSEFALRARVVPLGERVLCRTSDGWLLAPSEDLRLIAAMAETGGPLEPGTSLLCRAILAPGDAAVDVGAHIGTLTLTMGRAVGAEGKVWAFEPTPRTAQLLRTSMTFNGLDGIVSVVESAVAEQAGTAELRIGLTSGHNSILALDEATEMVSVNQSTLDELLPSSVFPKLIKLDVEGAELNALSGMRRVLDRSSDVSMIVEFAPSHLARTNISVDEWLGKFSSHGFTPWLIGEADGSIRAVTRHDLASVFSVNLLFLKHHPGRWPKLVVRN